jgi:hypothetical protein
MSPHNLQERLDAEASFSPRDVIESLGIAILLVSAVFVLVGLLLMPVAPV